MKKLLFIALAVTLALGIVWLPSVAAAEPYPIGIEKTIPAGGPIETFTFQGWRDMNNNKIVDAGDIDLGTVDITGAGTGVLYSPYLGQCIVREILAPDSVYEPQPDQFPQANCDTAYFDNKLKERGKIKILKYDEDGNIITADSPLMEFDITPNPYAAAPDPLRLVDNDSNDADPSNGTILLENVPLGSYTITEKVAPDGYELDPTSQTANVTVPGDTVTLEFVNPRLVAELIIVKQDPGETLLPGACFELTPDPRTCEGSLILCDNDPNDEEPQGGILLLTELQVCCPFTVVEIEAPPGYELDPTPQTGHATVAGELITLTFVNTKCGLIIHKSDDLTGDALAGACFKLTPDPRTGEDYLELCDNDANDECPEDGVLCLSELICGLECTIEETVAPPGYDLAPVPWTFIIDDTVELNFGNTKLPPDICIEKLVDCNDDKEYLHEDFGVSGDTPSWYIRVWNCGEIDLLNVMVSDTNGMSWGPFDLDVGEEWEVTYEGDAIYETTTNTAEAVAEDMLGGPVGPVFDSATNVITTPESCRITGGGTIGDGRDPRVTHGFELHCNVDQLPNNLEINWGGDHFHLLDLTFAECWNDPLIEPQPPRAGCDTYHGIGMGRYNGVDGYQAEWLFTDAGEPGKVDWAWIKITDPDGNTVMEVEGFLDKGNQQFHNCTGKDLR